VPAQAALPAAEPAIEAEPEPAAEPEPEAEPEAERADEQATAADAASDEPDGLPGDQQPAGTPDPAAHEPDLVADEPEESATDEEHASLPAAVVHESDPVADDSGVPADDEQHAEGPVDSPATAEHEDRPARALETPEPAAPTAAAEPDEIAERDETAAPAAPAAPNGTPEPDETAEPGQSAEPAATVVAAGVAKGAVPATSRPATPTSTPTSTGTDFDEFAAAAGEREPGERHSVEGKAAWGRLLKMSKPRATRGNLLVALLAVLLGAGIAAQVQLTNQRGLDELSQTDLVRVLDDVSLRASRLDSQVRELEATRDRLKSGTGTTAEALQQAQKRVDTLGILAGTIPAKGPGITLRISDPDSQVTAPIVLDIIQELRDAGAEAIDVGGVRVVASSFVGDRDGEIVVDSKTVSRPLVITVIGDSKTLSSAMTIPGGIVETVRQKGANASISESDLVEITSTHTPTELKNAKPVE
jgi:uncharacterized protein YlxW (UPF0749 family)